MPDPILVTTGIMGLLASILTITIKLNDLRGGFFEARTEIDLYLRELGDLTTILTRLQNSKLLRRLPDNLSRDLVELSESCKRTVKDIELLLHRSSLRPPLLRGLYWTTVGKNEFLQRCRSVEAHKANIGLFLTSNSWQILSEMSDKMDLFLLNVKTANQPLPEKNLTIQTVLEDKETCADSFYAQSSVTCADGWCQQGGIHDDEGQHNYVRQSYGAGLSANRSSEEAGKADAYDDLSSHDISTIKEQGTPFKTLQGHSGDISSIVFSKDGRQLVSGSRDKTLKIWDLETKSAPQTLHGHADQITSVVFVGDESCLASASSDQTVRLWDVATGYTVEELRGHSDRVSSMAYANNSGKLMSGSGDGTIRVWDMETASTVETLRGNCGGIWSMSLTDDGRQLASGSGNGTISIWDIRVGFDVQSFKGHSDGVWSMSSSKNELASGSWDSTIMLWDMRRGSATQTLRDHDGLVMSVVYMHERWLASGSEDEKNIKVWDTQTGSVVRMVDNKGSSISSMAFSAADGGQLASGSGARTIDLWKNILPDFSVVLNM